MYYTIWFKRTMRDANGAENGEEAMAAAADLQELLVKVNELVAPKISPGGPPLFGKPFLEVSYAITRNHGDEPESGLDLVREMVESGIPDQEEERWTLAHGEEREHAFNHQVGEGWYCDRCKNRVAGRDAACPTCEARKRPGQ